MGRPGWSVDFVRHALNRKGGRPVSEVLGFWLDYAGVATFAASSAAVSRRCGADLTATLLVACMAAIGGGTVRDLLIQQPIFWIVDPSYILSCVVAAAAIWFVGLGRRSGALVTLLEAVGIGSFAVVGTAKALSSGTGHVAAVVMGVLTATFGGIVADSLAGRRTVLVRKDIYVTAALASSAAYDFFALLQIDGPWAKLSAAGSGILLRLLAIHFRWRMPAPGGT